MLKFLMVGAHPDDMDLRCGGLAVLLKKRGHDARFLSLTAGNAGHHLMTRDALSARRRKEMENAGKVYGIQYDTFDCEDGYLQADIETRVRLIRYIREYQPDVIIAHRTCDYHPDHRAVGQLVNDCSYLVCVPLICSEIPAMRKMPVLLACEDRFMYPVAFRADIGVACDEVIDVKIEGVLQHESQVREWLPYDGHWTDVLEAKDEAEKTQRLIERHKVRFSAPVARFPQAFDPGTVFGEVYQIDEHGGSINKEIVFAMTGVKEGLTGGGK